MSQVKAAVPGGTLGFSFRMRANGVGGTFPKTYGISDIANRLLTGFVSEFSNLPVVALWASDPGDNILPQTSRDYGPLAPPGVTADGLCPNNVRLSQIPHSSIVASFGIGPGLAQANLPTSTNYDSQGLNTAVSLVQVLTLGNLCGIKRIRLQILDGGESHDATVLVNGGHILRYNIETDGPDRSFERPYNSVEFEVGNLGAVGIVNLGGICTVGVTAEMNL